jgi:hypothetical protein
MRTLLDKICCSRDEISLIFYEAQGIFYKICLALHKMCLIFNEVQGIFYKISLIFYEAQGIFYKICLVFYKMYHDFSQANGIFDKISRSLGQWKHLKKVPGTPLSACLLDETSAAQTFRALLLDRRFSQIYTDLSF